MHDGGIIARCQPAHWGHLHLIAKVAQKHDHVIVAVPEYKTRSISNPFTVDEATSSLREALRDNHKIDPGRVSVVGVRSPVAADKETVENTYRHLLAAARRPPIIYTGNSELYTQLLSYGASVVYVERDLLPEGDVSATDIRNRIASGRDWTLLVPPAVAAFIHTRGLESRVRKLFESQGLT